MFLPDRIGSFIVGSFKCIENKTVNKRYEKKSREGEGEGGGGEEEADRGHPQLAAPAPGRDIRPQHPRQPSQLGPRQEGSQAAHLPLREHDQYPSPNPEPKTKNNLDVPQKDIEEVINFIDGAKDREGPATVDTKKLSALMKGMFGVDLEVGLLKKGDSKAGTVTA